MTRFVEFIAPYEDGEKLDILINVEQIKHVRADYKVPEETLIQLVGEENPIRVCVPYAFVVNALRSAEK